MMRAALVAVVALVLAGCAGPPDIPDGTPRHVEPGLPGLELAAWSEERGGYTYLHAVVQNTGSATYETKEDCGYLWQSQVRINGTPVQIAQDTQHTCDWVYDFLRPGDSREYLHSWDGRVWNGTQPVEAPQGEAVWSIRFLLRDGSVHATQAPIAGRSIHADVVLAVIQAR